MNEIFTYSIRSIVGWITIEGVISLTKAMSNVVSNKKKELIDALSPQEEKCGKERGIGLNCWDCDEPKGHCPIHDVLPKSGERCDKCNNYFDKHRARHRIGGKVYHTSCLPKAVPPTTEIKYTGNLDEDLGIFVRNYSKLGYRKSDENDDMDDSSGE